MCNKNVEENYWFERPDDFADIYKVKHKYSSKTIVRKFLHDRTRKLSRLLELSKDMSLLDVGCGSGEHILLLADRVKRTIGLDISLKMLLMAKNDLERVNKNRNWALLNGDAGVLPFADNSFGCVISVGLLDYVDSCEEVMEEWYRVLQNGGLIIFTLPKRPSVFSLLRTRFGNMIKRLIFKLPLVKNVMNRKDLLDLMRSSGFICESMDSVWTAMWIIKARKKHNSM